MHNDAVWGMAAQIVNKKKQRNWLKCTCSKPTVPTTQIKHS